MTPGSQWIWDRLPVLVTVLFLFYAGVFAVNKLYWAAAALVVIVSVLVIVVNRKTRPGNRPVDFIGGFRLMLRHRRARVLFPVLVGSSAVLMVTSSFRSSTVQLLERILFIWDLFLAGILYAYFLVEASAPRDRNLRR